MTEPTVNDRDKAHKCGCAWLREEDGGDKICWCVRHHEEEVHSAREEGRREAVWTCPTCNATGVRLNSDAYLECVDALHRCEKRLRAVEGKEVEGE